MSSALRRAAVRVLAARACTTEAASDGLAPVIAELSPDDRRRLALLARDMHGYLQPADAIERGWVDRVTAALWRRNLLDRLEIRLLHALAEGREVAGLPSLDALARARNRIDKDEVVFRRNLAELHRNAARITPHTDSARLAWLAERAAAREALVRRVCAAAGDPQEGRPFPSLHRSRGPAGSPPRPQEASERSRPAPTATRRDDPAAPPRPGAARPAPAAPARPSPAPGGAPRRPEPSATVPSADDAAKPAAPGKAPAPATVPAAERAASPVRPAPAPDRPAGGPVGAAAVGAGAAAAPGGGSPGRPAPAVAPATIAEAPGSNRIAAHAAPEPSHPRGPAGPGSTATPPSSGAPVASAKPTPASAGPTAAVVTPLPLARTG